MSTNHGRCPLCGGAKQPGTTTFAVDLQFGVMVVRDVPALVCAMCGDAWIEHQTVKKLEAVVANARREKAQVEVTHWLSIAA